MAESPRAPIQTPRSVRILHVGGGAGQAERVRAALERSRTLASALVHVDRVSDVADHPDAKEAEAVLFDLCGGAARLQSLAALREILPRLPIVVLGEDDSEEAANEALAHGASGYLLPEESATRLLVTTIGAALGSQRALLQLDTAREQARHLATHDQLTGLANRVLFNDRLTQAVAAARRSRQVLAVLYLDLDGFRAINDALGNAVGDGLLRGIANQVTSSIGETDTAARLGGDEFAVILTQLPSELDAARVAGRIAECLARPVRFGQRSVAPTASIGIATFPRDGVDPDDLVRKAELAMRHAKEQGRNRYEFYAGEMNAAVLRRVSVESRLRRALDEQALILHYQPQYDLRRSRIVGCEALIRWNHPEHGILPPSEFLGVAEDSGLIVPIGAWVLQEACRQTAIWHAAGHVGLRIAVNVSSRQFREQGFEEVVSAALAETGLRPESLELEITEGSLIADVDSTITTLYALKRLGVRLSIDDFGTGYSALSYLKRLPVDVLKIDQSFVRELTTHPVNATITEAIVRLARGLDLATIAEGVETPEQLLLLGSYGCHRMQGFLFGRPSPPEQFAEWLAHPPFRWTHGESGRRL